MSLRIFFHLDIITTHSIPGDHEDTDWYLGYKGNLTEIDISCIGYVV